MEQEWTVFAEALSTAMRHLENDPDPLNDREAADRSRYGLRILAGVTQSSMIRLDPDNPSFLPMLETVRYLGGAGPDIDYDVAAVRPGIRYRISGTRGGASYAGIAVYAGTGESGATAIVESVDLDDVTDGDGSFSWEFQHPEAVRVIVRQYFHDRARQPKGAWSIRRITGEPTGTLTHPTAAEMRGRLANAASSMVWNATLNSLWTPERRAFPNEFVRQTSADIVAAVPNPDVTYSFTWWRVDEGDALVIDVVPPRTRYWSMQIGDRWFQVYPDRRTNLNDEMVTPNRDGSVTLVLSDGDPGHPNWLDTAGHRTGVAFFRWLHADVEIQPRCRVLPVSEVPRL